MLIKHIYKVYLVIIMPKDLLKHVLILLPLETISMIMLKNAGKKKLFEKIRKNKIIDKSPTLSKIVLAISNVIIHIFKDAGVAQQ